MVCEVLGRARPLGGAGPELAPRLLGAFALFIPEEKGDGWWVRERGGREAAGHEDAHVEAVSCFSEEPFPANSASLFREA